MGVHLVNGLGERLHLAGNGEMLLLLLLQVLKDFVESVAEISLHRLSNTPAQRQHLFTLLQLHPFAIQLLEREGGGGNGSKKKKKKKKEEGRRKKKKKEEEEEEETAVLLRLYIGDAVIC